MKTFAFICSALFSMSISISCNKEDAIKPLTASAHSNSIQGHFIGEHFGGGTVVYLNKTKNHGVIAANEDFEEAATWSSKNTLNGALSAGIGTGTANTNHIYKTQGRPQFEEEYAALQCINLIENGYSDWCLPSKDDLNELYLHKDVISNLKPFAYWSSTEVDTATAWFQNLGSGAQVQQLKTSGYAVRAVRYF
ncbi:MAG: DUF1566 domain-containing protein [Parafilimonas sp.]|nr:DUF1566 domain-containing protein [Parafilimonas sp.]